MSNKKKLIILVATKSGFWEGVKVWGQISPPTGLLAIASSLTDKYEVKIVDQRIRGWKNEIESLLKRDPLFVGVSFMTGIQIKFTLELCKYIKSISDVKIVAGGIHPTLCPEQTLASECFDFLILGEGEKTVFELAKNLEEEGDVSTVRGIAFIKNKKLVKTGVRDYLDLNELKPWPYYLVDLKKYSYIDRFGMIIETSRGCPFKCTYCFNANFNHGTWRAKSAGAVLEEIKFLNSKYQINHFHVIDDNFFVDLERAREILENILRLNKGIKLEFQGVRIDSVNKMDDHFLSLLKKLGGTLRIGIDSGSQKILDLVNKMITIEQCREANLKLAKSQIRTYYNFVIGFPFETDEDLKKTTNFAIELMDQNPFSRVEFIAIYQPYPGTVLFDECVAKNYFIAPSRLEDWSRINWDESNLRCFTKKKSHLLRKIHIASAGLIIRKYSDYSKLSFAWKILSKLYRHIVRFRMKNLFFNLFIEEYCQNIFCKKAYYKKDYLVK